MTTRTPRQTSQAFLEDQHNPGKTMSHELEDALATLLAKAGQLGEAQGPLTPTILGVATLEAIRAVCRAALERPFVEAPARRRKTLANRPPECPGTPIQVAA